VIVSHIILFYRYCTGKPPAGYTNPDDVVWIRPEEMKITQSPQFIDDGAAANDVK
jgi:hypothetical protein